MQTSKFYLFLLWGISDAQKKILIPRRKRYIYYVAFGRRT